MSTLLALRHLNKCLHHLELKCVPTYYTWGLWVSYYLIKTKYNVTNKKTFGRNEVQKPS